MAVPTKTRKTSKRNKAVISREVIGIRQETTENYLSFVCNTELCIFIFKNNSNLWNLNLSHFSQQGSKSENQGHFKPFIEDIILTYKLISRKQLDICIYIYGKRKRKQQFGGSLQCESYRQNFQQKLRRLN